MSKCTCINIAPEGGEAKIEDFERGANKGLYVLLNCVPFEILSFEN